MIHIVYDPDVIKFKVHVLTQHATRATKDGLLPPSANSRGLNVIAGTGRAHAKTGRRTLRDLYTTLWKLVKCPGRPLPVTRLSSPPAGSPGSLASPFSTLYSLVPWLLQSLARTRTMQAPGHLPRLLPPLALTSPKPSRPPGHS